jgi:hypothetical protein
LTVCVEHLILVEATEQDGRRYFGLEQGQVLADAHPRGQPEGWRLPLGK